MKSVMTSGTYWKKEFLSIYLLFHFLPFLLTFNGKLSICFCKMKSTASNELMNTTNKHKTYYMFHTSLCELHFILAIWRKNYIGAFVDKHQHQAPTKSLGHYYFNQIYLQTYLSWQAAERDFNLWGIFQQHTRYSADSSTISYLQHYRSPIISTNGATFLQLLSILV